jgi:predicted RND superfamily exporter protein
MKIISIISPFFHNHIVPFIKNNWQLIVIIFLIILFIFSDNSNKKLIKEYEKQIKESEKLVKNYRKDIKIIDKKIDSLNIIIKKLENDEVEIVDKIKEVDKLRDEKNKKIDKIQSPDSLIMLYPFRDNGERKPKIK